NLAVHIGSRLYTDSASSYRALTGYLHEYVNHTKKEYARGDVHENRAELWFDRIRGGLAPHKMAPSILDSLVLYFILMITDSWTLGPWNMWKCLSKYARKCYGFPRAHLPFLPHNMARPPKNMFATALRVSLKNNVRKNRERHIICQN